MLSPIRLTLLSLLPTLASADILPSTAVVYQTSTLTFTLAAATSYLTISTPTPPPASPTTTLLPSPSSTSTDQYTSDPLFISTLLNTTNTYRTAYNATPLTWNNTLATYASTHASKCAFAHSYGPYGENIAETYLNVTAAVEGWGSEGRRYDWSNPGFGEGTGHFTQLVWRGTESVGCGRVDCDGNSVGGNATGWFVVCEYYPAGNVDGQYTQEVGKAVGKCVGSGGGAAGKEVQAVCAKFSGAERVRRGWGVWSWEAVVVVGAWIVVRGWL